MVNLVHLCGELNTAISSMELTVGYFLHFWKKKKESGLTAQIYAGEQRAFLIIFCSYETVSTF